MLSNQIIKSLTRINLNNNSIHTLETKLPKPSDQIDYNVSGYEAVLKNEIKLISCVNFQKDVLDFIKILPPEIDSVIGISRSGIYPASLISTMLHLPIGALRQSKKDIIELGNGWRLQSDDNAESHRSLGNNPIIIDDTVMTGRSMIECKKIALDKYPNAIFGSIYCNPIAKEKPNIYLRELDHPHFLEWNLFNSLFSKCGATDFDGVICEDCRPEDDDDGPNYIKFLMNARPRYITRKSSIPLIVTARLEKYRGLTEMWLKKYGISCDKLVMHPASSLEERNKDDISLYKSKHIKEWMENIPHKSVWRFPFFIESNEYQAQKISKLTPIITVCTDNLKCYKP